MSYFDFSAILASKLLDETLSILGKLGCVVCLLGSTVFIIHAPKEQDLSSLDELQFQFWTSGIMQMYQQVVFAHLQHCHGEIV